MRCNSSVYENGIGVFLMRSQEAAVAVIADRVASTDAARQASMRPSFKHRRRSIPIRPIRKSGLLKAFSICANSSGSSSPRTSAALSVARNRPRNAWAKAMARYTMRTRASPRPSLARAGTG